MARKYKLTELNPRWVPTHGEDPSHAHHVEFDCPEGHADCKIIVPFSPCLDGKPHKAHGTTWGRKGNTFESLTLTPSIRCIPRYKSREEYDKAGRLPQYWSDAMMCAFHGFVKDGIIEFCPDSK